MKTPCEILDYVGRDRAATVLRVSADRIRLAAQGTKLPASWLDALERLARRPLPRELFTFKGGEE